MKTVETSINKGKHAEKAVKTSKIVKLNEKRVEQGISLKTHVIKCKERKDRKRRSGLRNIR